MMNRIFSLPHFVRALIFSCALFWLDSCYYDNEEDLYDTRALDCTTIPATYNTNVQTIINTKCAITGCHNSSGAGGTVLTTYANVKLKTDRINQRVIKDKTMPPGGGMTTEQLNILSCWISNGAPQ
jgi:uncharacterized membrane protein